MYEVFIILHKGTNSTLNEYGKILKKMYSGESSNSDTPLVWVRALKIEVVFSGITFTIRFNKSHEVLEESRAISLNAWEEHKSEVAQSHSRFEIISTEDSKHKYRTELLLIVQAAVSLGEIWAYDNSLKAFI